MIKIRTNLQVSPNRAQLTDFTFNVPYDQQLSVVNGKFPPYTWILEEGRLPNGLSLGSSDGKISGLPLEIGTFTFTVKVIDCEGNVGIMDYHEVIVGTLVIDQDTLTIGQEGENYEQQLTCSNAAVGALTWSTTSLLPPGLVLTDTGKLTGTPATYGTWFITIKVMDSLGNVGSRQYD